MQHEEDPIAHTIAAAMALGFYGVLLIVAGNVPTEDLVTYVAVAPGHPLAKQAAEQSSEIAASSAGRARPRTWS